MCLLRGKSQNQQKFLLFKMFGPIPNGDCNKTFPVAQRDRKSVV